MEYRRIKMPKQDWSIPFDSVKEVKLSDEIVEEITKCAMEFEKNGKLDPKLVRDGLRYINFHKEHPEIFKIIEDLCLECDLKDRKINTDDFMDYINDHMADNNTKKGLNRIFESIADKKVGEITPENLSPVFAKDLSDDDIKYLLEVISDPSKEINIDPNEFYYIMTQKPGDVVNIITATKGTKAN